MAFIIDGTTGIATPDGTVSAPSQRGQDTNSGISYAADTIKFSTNGVERMAITNNGITGVSTTEAACTPKVGTSSSIQHAVANNLTYSNVTGDYLLGNVSTNLSASTIYGIEAYVELHHHSSSASHGYLGGWLYQTGKTYNVDGAYFQNNMYNAYSTALRFTYLLPWDPSGTQSLSLYITSSLETGTNNYFNIGVQNKLENI